MSSLYWSARQGELPVADAAKLAYMLSQLGRLIEGGELERRLRELEAEVDREDPR
jgi:hypothetical protein